MPPDTTRAPDFSTTDESRNWVYLLGPDGRRTAHPVPPAWVISAARGRSRLSETPIVDDVLIDALVGELRSPALASDRNAQLLEQSLVESKRTRVLSPRAWTTIVAWGLGTGWLQPTSESVRALMNGSVALGTNAQLAEVRFPVYGVTVGGSTTPPAVVPPGPSPLAPPSPTTWWSTWKWPIFGIGAVLAVVVILAFVLPEKE